MPLLVDLFSNSQLTCLKFHPNRTSFRQMVANYFGAHFLSAHSVCTNSQSQTLFKAD